MESEIKTRLKAVSPMPLISFFRVITKNKTSLVGLIILIVFLAMAIFSPIFIEPPRSNYANRFAPPSRQHILGTDMAGMDVLVQLMLGSRNVLLIAFWAGIFAVFIGSIIGILAGLSGGKIDAILTMLTNIVLTIPSFPIMMILSIVVRINNSLLFGLMLGVWSWAGLAKAVRSQVLIIKNREFIEASRVIGLRLPSIIIYDVFPNVLSYIFISFITIMRGAIMASVGLMVLGLVPFAGNHWGIMINTAISQSGALFGGAALMYFISPVTFIVVFQMGCYLFASGLDLAMNPRLRA
ncbi:MAG: ABC transporter permease [Treponema sp.]|nr:ABC transporter permease [Treponema sp.]